MMTRIIYPLCALPVLFVFSILSGGWLFVYFYSLIFLGILGWVTYNKMCSYIFSINAFYAALKITSIQIFALLIFFFIGVGYKYAAEKIINIQIFSGDVWVITIYFLINFMAILVGKKLV